jgi:predicted O-methyltransferase YrrM
LETKIPLTRDLFRRDYLGEELNSFLEVKKEALREGIPIIEDELGHFLSFFISLLQPRRILEIGSGNGYSALWLEKKLQTGRIITVERSYSRIWLAEKNIKSFSRGKIDLIFGNALKIFKEEEIFDLVFIDGRKNEYPLYLDLESKL